MMAWKSNLQFRVIDGRFEIGRIWPLTQQRINVGRLPSEYEPEENELLFREPTLSRIHATLTWKAWKKGYLLEHKSDVNPTLVNGKPTKKLLLAPGDRVQMGLLILELEDATEGVSPRNFQEKRAERLRMLHTIVAEVQQEFSHVIFDDDGPKG